jgi:DNA helicase-2/ATP-dependent DNA helicase PcrA
MAFDFGNANDQQKEAIQTTEGPLLIIAGPGTGKTFTLVKRIVYLITERGIQPEEIMVATFTEKAAKELITRITNELYKMGVQVNLNEMYVGTFHSICLRVIKEHLEYTRVKKNYRMLDQFDQKYMIFQHINDFRALPHYEDIFTKKIGTWKQAGEIAKYVSNLLEELVDVNGMLRDSNPATVGMANVLALYQKITEEENLIDFSSIQTEAYSLMLNHPEILAEIREKIKYVMVDEYQDTNYIQELIVFLIAGESENICVVGDDDQGLYRFRGATIRNILEFPDHFIDGKCKRVDLTINYRSEKEIIDFYNDWMTSTDEKFVWKNFRFPKKIVPGKKDYSSDTRVVKCSGKNGVEDWYDSVYDFVISLKHQGVIKDYNQVAFLCKSVKNDKVINLIQYLEAMNIPVYSPRSEMFFTRPEVKEILGCLIMCFPNYFLRLKTESFTYSYPDLYRYYREECVEAAQKLIKAHKDLKKWYENILRNHSQLKSNTDYAFTGILYQLLEFEPFRGYVGIDIGSGVTDERAARNISILSAVLGKYEYLHRIEVFSEKNIISAPEIFFNMYMRFLFEGGITEYEDDSEYAPSGCISFMTIHQSKGMEFPVVMVDSLSAVPRTQSDGVIEEIEKKYFHRPAFEAKEDIKFFDFWRLYYTAFSRAQNLLVLSCYEKNGIGRTPSKYFESCYNTLPSYNDVDLSEMELEMVKPVNIKKSFSFTSHIELYENCSLQYKFFKELGFTQIRVGATLFGTLVHETIEDVHRAAMRHEESTITPDNVRAWLDTNYLTLSKSEHSYLGVKQVDAAYRQVIAYIERMSNGTGLTGDGAVTGESLWSHIQDAEVDVSLVKPEYILKGTVDLIRGDGNTVEIVDFKSEKRPDLTERSEDFERYKRQLEVYAHLVEEKTGKNVSRMHLYYTGEEGANPTVTFEKSQYSIDKTISEFDKVVAKIQNHEFSTEAKNKKSCLNCDMRYYCKKVKKQ